jgi:hypothetical protein
MVGAWRPGDVAVKARMIGGSPLLKPEFCTQNAQAKPLANRSQLC